MDLTEETKITSLPWEGVLNYNNRLCFKRTSVLWLQNVIQVNVKSHLIHSYILNYRLEIAIMTQICSLENITLGYQLICSPIFSICYKSNAQRTRSEQN